MPSRAQVFLLLASLAGAAFCLLNAAGADLLCLTEGCRIYASYGIFGISFYTVGAAGFVALFLLGLLYPRRPAPALLAGALLIGLALDSLFLAWQTLFWSCFGCLTVALLFGAAALGGYFLVPAAARKPLIGTGIVWLVFFIAVALSAGKEIAFKPWPLAGDPEAPVKVFFSPDCPACQRLVTTILNDADMASRTAFFPVAKGETDRRRLAAYLAGGEGRPGDLSTLFRETAGETVSLDLRTRLRLLANKAALARTGAVTVPLIITPDLPERAATRFDLTPSADALFAPRQEEGCPAFEEKECD